MKGGPALSTDAEAPATAVPLTFVAPAEVGVNEVVDDDEGPLETPVDSGGPTTELSARPGVVETRAVPVDEVVCGGGVGRTAVGASRSAEHEAATTTATNTQHRRLMASSLSDVTDPGRSSKTPAGSPQGRTTTNRPIVTIDNANWKWQAGPQGASSFFAA